MSRIITGRQAQDVKKRALDILEQSVGSTLGAKGKAVAIDRGYEKIILRDGVSVAKAIELEDKGENTVLSIMREAAQKTVDEVGDSTTATIILSHALYSEGEKRIAAGIDAREFVEEIEEDIRKAVELLQEQATPVKTLAQKIQVATISSEEESLGKLIGETIHEVGNDGVVSVDKSKNGETYVDMQEGMQWDRGLASPYFITDPESMTATVEGGRVLVTDFELNTMSELLPVIKQLVEVKGIRFFTIIAPEFGGDVLPSMIANKVKGTFLGVCVKAPASGRQQTNMLQDIAILTGATFITKEQGHTLENVTLEQLGSADRVSASQTTALIAGGEGKKELIKARIKEVKAQLEKENSEFEKERLRERLAKLSKGVAVIKVGGKTDIEIKERFERALDATLATRQAVKKGIVIGGEIGYLHLIPAMKSVIVKKALEAPFRRLMTNASLDAGQMLEKLLKEPQGIGIDVIDGKVKDMVKEGIIDPVACLIAALQNASSVACNLLITETLIVPPNDTEKGK